MIAAYNSGVSAHQMISTKPTGPCDGPFASFPLVGRRRARIKSPLGIRQTPKLGWPESNRRIRESKSRAFPLGYTPLFFRRCSWSNWQRIIFAIFVRSCRIPCPWLNSSHSMIFSQNWHSSFMSLFPTIIIHLPLYGEAIFQPQIRQDIVPLTFGC